MTRSSPGSGYRMVSLLMLPFWLIHALWHGKKNVFGQYISLRFWGRKGVSKKPVIWVHSASVGEVEAILPLVNALLDQGEAILFTSFTASGYKTIRHNFNDTIETGIIPADFVWFCRRFFRLHPIKLCLLMETELWPELLYQAARNNLPIIQVNARLSRKSLDAPIFIRYLLRRTMDYISLHLTRNSADRENLMRLGANPRNIKLVGNLKSRKEEPAIAQDLIGRDYLLLASSHEGEERMMLEQRPSNAAKMLIVIAPRHPTRSKAIQQQLTKLGVNYAVRSESQAISAQTEVYLADTLGELKALMAHACIVVMGGSFDQTGGHNLIEPATLARAIITGPSDSNILDDIELLAASNGVIQVSSMSECWQKINDLLDNPDQAIALGNQAQQAISRTPDILATYLAEIEPYL
jgi:3-deoxy-D-manno-octulosonic-acid transferase